MKKIYTIILMCFVLSISLVPVKAADVSDAIDISQEITTVTGKSVSLMSGKTKKVSIKNIKTLKKCKSVTFVSSKKSVVKLSNATKKSVVLNGLKPGKSTITIKAASLQYKFVVTVKDPNAIDISATSIKIPVGETKKVYLKNYKTLLKTYKDKSVYFEINYGDIAKLDKVKDGYAIIKGKKEGKALLTITTSKKKYKCKIIIG